MIYVYNDVQPLSLFHTAFINLGLDPYRAAVQLDAFPRQPVDVGRLHLLIARLPGPVAQLVEAQVINKHHQDVGLLLWLRAVLPPVLPSLLPAVPSPLHQPRGVAVHALGAQGEWQEQQQGRHGQMALTSMESS